MFLREYAYEKSCIILMCLFVLYENEFHGLSFTDVYIICHYISVWELWIIIYHDDAFMKEDLTSVTSLKFVCLFFSARRVLVNVIWCKTLVFIKFPNRFLMFCIPVWRTYYCYIRVENDSLCTLNTKCPI